MKKLLSIILLSLPSLIWGQCTIDLSMNGTFVDEQKGDTVQLEIKGMEVFFKDAKGVSDKQDISKIEVHTTAISDSYIMVTFHHNWENDITIIVSPDDKNTFSIFEKFDIDQYGDPTVLIAQTFKKLP